MGSSMNEKYLGFHVLRDARDHYQFENNQFDYLGKAAIPNFQAARSFSNRMNQKRDIHAFPYQAVLPSQVNAIALVQGITHYIFDLYHQRHPQILENALEHLREELGEDVNKTLEKYVAEFPPLPVYQREVTQHDFMNGDYDNRRNEETVLEELLMLWLANSNPAFSSYLELFNDDPIKKTAYPRITTALNKFFADIAQEDQGDGMFPGGMSIIEILLEPIRLAPHSLEGQIRIMIDRWGSTLGGLVYRLLTALDIMKEDFRAIPGPGGPGGKGTTPVPYWDRAVAYDVETENYTPDREWMPNLVLIAKNAYVWMDQLSKKHKLEITHLDQIPDEELDQLQKWGITGLWLIGLWERSRASQRVKVMCGNPDAVASAYSLLDYAIAERLGGEAAVQNLRARAWKRGIRLASDMVPNHMGIDSTWVVNNPDWFISLPYSPYPNYTFNGANLSWDGHVGIYLEDHYYDRTDAAVVFKRIDHHTGDTRYIYHGNDGTSMPWNDTAQLNYLHADVREAMIRVIIDIAKQFPIIRFDAAMTLVKKHIQRLWFPEPGSGGAIPSRSEHGMTRAELDQLMTEEFWREVVDRAAIEAPDTLLLAEAFWLMEGYFVRTLGMHRVYNSAFMNMLRDEENAKYRSVIKNTIEFDPEVLRRYVNFLNNPDEKTAVEQFGKGDKYFGVCTLMVTMPGLPMLGHGQIEGFAEKYGMEYYRAYWDEQPDQYLIQRHEHDIFPLCKKRYLFAGVENFLLYDFYVSGGGVDENVYAYSNRYGDEHGLVFYNNAFNPTAGWIKVAAAFSAKTGKGDERRIVQRTLSEGLGLPNANKYCIFRDVKSDLEYIRHCRGLVKNGLYVELSGYQYMVLVDFRIVNATAQYDQINGYLDGRGVPSIDDALRELLMEPVRAPFREIVNGEVFKKLLDMHDTKIDAKELDKIESKLVTLVSTIREFNGVEESKEDKATIKTPKKQAEFIRKLLETLLALPSKDTPPSIAEMLKSEEYALTVWGGLLGWSFAHALGDDPETSRSRIDEWLIGRLIIQALRGMGLEEFQAIQALAGVKLATSLPNLFTPTEDERADTLLETLLRDMDAQQWMNVNHFQGVVWFNQQGFDQLLQWLVLLAQVNDKTSKAIKQRYQVVEQLRQACLMSDYQVEKLRNSTRRVIEKPTAAAPKKKPAAKKKTPKPK